MDQSPGDTGPFQSPASSLQQQKDKSRRRANKYPRISNPSDEIRDSPHTLQASTSINRIVHTGASSIDTSNIQSGCSVKSIHDIISRFGDQKRKLVESIGFRGLLKFPPVKFTNRKFSAWLMGLVDIKNSSLVLPDGNILKFGSEDVALVFDIPADGKSVSEAKQLDRVAKERMKLQCWPKSHRGNQSIKAVEDVVDATYNDPMTPVEEDAFKIAFVVFVMSTLFVPGAKHDYAHVDYWGALSNPSLIHEYNWAAYIHKRLLGAASKYKSDIETGSRTPIITGCYLFLQVFYLDNMDIPNWAMDHAVRPRVSSFNNEIIRSMIAADTHERHDWRETCVYGKSKVRPRGQSCYTWARQDLECPLDAYSTAANSLWQAVLSLITILGVPLEAAGPLYMAAAEINRPSSASIPRTAIDCIAILLRIVEPFRNGFNYSFDLHQNHLDLQAMEEIPEILWNYCAGTEYRGATCGRICRKRAYGVSIHGSRSVDLGTMAMRSLVDLRCPDSEPSKQARIGTQVPPVGLSEGGGGQDTICGIEYTVVKIMARFYLLVRYARERSRLDLNTATADDDPSENDQQACRLHRFQQAAPPKTPWQLGDAWLCSTQGMDVLADTADSSSSTMPRILDYHPKYIEVMPAAAQDQRIGFSEMDLDMFDAMIRCFKHSDDALYVREGRLRWRHYFESDILTAVLAGCFDVNNPCMRNQFIGSHLGYDIYNCNMLFFPVILHARWVCFSWDLKENSIVVFDPAGVNIPVSLRRALYKRVVGMLKDTLSSAIPYLIPSWRHDWNPATILTFDWSNPHLPCSNRTGVLCAYFCRCFNGQQLQPHIMQNQVEHVAEKLFAEVKALREDRMAPGRVPTVSSTTPRGSTP